VSVARTDAVVVGAGPNGLAAALTLARQGFRVEVLEAADEPGGGARSRDDLTVPGVLHDVCSAVHPFGAASPFLRSLPLERHGLEWAHPEVAVAHPLDGGDAGLLYRDLERTAAGLGEDGARWRRLFGHSARRFDALAEDLLGPMLRLPRHLVTTGRTGALALLPATALAAALRTERARALFGGVASHLYQPLDRPLSASVGVMMVAAGHAYGWPVARGGSMAITRAMVGLLEELGGRIHTGVRVRSLQDLPPARVALFDVTPGQLEEIAGDRMPAGDRRRARRWRHGSAAYKVDYAVRGGVPWAAGDVARAGTVHLSGSFEETVEVERDIDEGRLPDRPFVLLAQQHVADPDRARADVVPVWAYAHVPHAWEGDVGPLVDAQIERFAPGFTDRIVARHETSPAGFEAYNPNYVGGDIAGGATDPWQLVARPRLSPDPYRTGVPGVWLCSSSTPPGAGVHGLCGFHAARSALRVLVS
jgi:phytoene dehydrogenase-like protein